MAFYIVQSCRFVLLSNFGLWHFLHPNRDKCAELLSLNGSFFRTLLPFMSGKFFALLLDCSKKLYFLRNLGRLWFA